MREKKGTENIKPQNLVSRIISYFILVICVLLFFSLIKSVNRVKSIEKTIKDMELGVEKSKREQSELEKKLEYTKSEEFIESQLRDKLGMAKEGEIVIITIQNCRAQKIIYNRKIFGTCGSTRFRKETDTERALI